MQNPIQRHIVILEEKIHKVKEKFRKGHFKCSNTIARHKEEIFNWENQIKELQSKIN